MNDFVIEKVENGYIVSKSGGTAKRVYVTLEEVMSDLLQWAEGRGKYFGGKSFGVVSINRDAASSKIDPA